ncbi:SDR family NAD(P)-dependent oxidoreductase [Salegentibacter sediminis]|uniref:SDR family NAD(P)-dependent oxidoreductase n=1 Tax=Salegentibacter sediminis TaxID=1930251 RepID=UPI0009BF7398|nr:SDR family NAD(P)-dependent oxidoreductase [Salegentibacter sediminis]
MKRLENKVALITGGAGGIGLETARLFLAEGAKVFLTDLEEEKLKKAAESLKSDKVAWFAADVSKAGDTKKYLEKCLYNFSKIDIFFSNAGIEGKTSSIAEYPEEVFDRVIAVNLKGVWLGCQHVIPRMEDGGSVIITSSVAGLKGFPKLGAYVASKHGVIGIMRTAALEFAERKIRVNSIHPGPVDNRMMRSIEDQLGPDNPEEVKGGFENSIPFGRYAESKEIGQLALFLASDESKYITGTQQVIDGGMYIK